jgi:hypothetical protein
MLQTGIMTGVSGLLEMVVQLAISNEGSRSRKLFSKGFQYLSLPCEQPRMDVKPPTHHSDLANNGHRIARADPLRTSVIENASQNGYVK